MIDFITGNKKPMYLPYPFWIRLILAYDEGYFENHGISIPIPSLSSKIINSAPAEDDLHITIRMQKWIDKAYMVESSDSKEEDDDEEDNDEDAKDNEGVDEEENIANEEEDSSDKEDNPLIQDMISKRTVYPSSQAENVTPMPTPIQTTTVYQGE